MDYKLEHVINQFSDNIENGDFQPIFDYMYSEQDPSLIGAFSEFLYDAEVFYLEEMDVVPMCAFYKAKMPLLEIPNNIIKIEDYAFSFAEIESITMPKSVQEVEENAFLKTKVQEINYLGNSAQWNSLNINLPRSVKVNFK